MSGIRDPQPASGRPLVVDLIGELSNPAERFG
jgi:hypothetical protein